MTSKLIKFLSNIKTTAWKEIAHSSLHKIVIGNEACDLDSAISAIIYAYFLQSLDEKMELGVVYPVLNIKKEDYILRTEVKYWLNQFSVLDDLLIFRDDVDFKQLVDTGNIQIYLIDHNVLPSSDAFLEPYVFSVLDHHQLERTDTPDYGMIIEPVGSCATLVASEINTKNPNALEEDVAHLLYGTIILDTVNFSEAARRTTPKDVKMVEYLESFLKTGNDKRLDVFESLIHAKSDISHLTSEQIFRKDLKIVNKNNISVAVASVPQLIKNFLLRENISDCLRDIGERFNYDLIVLMGIDVSGEWARDLAVLSSRKTLRNELSSYLINGKNGILRLEPNEDLTDGHRAVFHQGNSVASRKVILPLVKEWLESKN